MGSCVSISDQTHDADLLERALRYTLRDPDTKLKIKSGYDMFANKYCVSCLHRSPKHLNRFKVDVLDYDDIFQTTHGYVYRAVSPNYFIIKLFIQRIIDHDRGHCQAPESSTYHYSPILSMLKKRKGDVLKIDKDLENIGLPRVISNMVFQYLC